MTLAPLGAGARATAHPLARRRYLDWMRGLAVLVMIEAHLVDSWTGMPDRQSGDFARALIVGGMGAPLFLFLAGVAVPLSAGSKARRTGDASAAARAVARRGLEIFGLAFVFRLQALILGWGEPASLLKVDVLNIMGPSIVAAALLWGAAGSSRVRYAIFACATLATALLTPLVRVAEWLAVLPNPIEAYIRPVAGMSSFVLFPWSAFVFGGAIAGVAIDGLRTARAERRLNAGFLAAGAAIALMAYGASFQPTPYARSSFWTSSPSFFFIRLGLIVAAVGVAYFWGARPRRWLAFSPLEQLGRTSLFIYWIHVEMIYGLVSSPLHHSLTLPQAGVALALFSLFMLACSIAKDRVVSRWRMRVVAAGSPPQPAV